MCLLLYYANYIKLLDKVADDVSELRNSLKTQEKDWQNDGPLFILETDETDHESERDRKSKWALNFSWKFWKMWRIGKKESDKQGNGQVRILLLPKKSEISIVPVKTDSLHIIIPAKKPHFDWRFWKKKCVNEKSVYVANISEEQSGSFNLEKHLDMKLRTREMIKSKLSKKRGGVEILDKKDKYMSKCRRGSFFDSMAVSEELIEKYWKLRSLQDHTLPSCKSLKLNGPQQMIVASVGELDKDNEWEDEGDTDYGSDGYYFDKSTRSIFVGRNIVAPDQGTKDKKKEWLTRDDTLIKEADITDPDIKKRDIIPRRKRRSKFGSFDMKTTIVSETPTPQSPYAKKRLSNLYFRKVPPKPKAPPPPPKRKPTSPPKREKTPTPEPQPVQSEPRFESEPQPQKKQRPEPKKEPPPKAKAKPKREPPPKPEPKQEPVEPHPLPVKRQVTERSLAKLRIPLRLANRKLQIRIPKRLLLESIRQGEQNGRQELNKRVKRWGGRIGVRGLNARSRKVLHASRNHLQAIGLEVLDDHPQPGCIFKRAFGRLCSSSGMSETSDDEEELLYREPSLTIKGKGGKLMKKRLIGKSKIRIKIKKPKKPCGTSVYKCLRSVRGRGICCCCGKTRKAHKTVCSPERQGIIEDSTISVHDKRGCCPCWCCLFRRKERCNCQNPKCGGRVGGHKCKSNPCDSKMEKICRAYIRDLQTRMASGGGSSSPRVFIKRRGRHYHSLLDEDSSDDFVSADSFGSDASIDSREMRPAVSRDKSRHDPQANYSMSAISLRNEFTEASHSRLKNTNSILDSYLLFG
uniref:Repellent protein 1 n=1 Tax=Lygus hesperus TaxID=30085 RepID=A0A0A9W433_LYGHE